MNLPEILQIGVRLFRYFGSPAGRMAIYPKQDATGWHLLVKAEQAVVPAGAPTEFEGVEVRYERY